MGLKNPVIIYELCEECGKCIEACTRGVFANEDTKRPEVKNPDACADDCYACSDVCPVDAVMYFGNFNDGCGYCHETGYGCDSGCGDGCGKGCSSGCGGCEDKE